MRMHADGTVDLSCKGKAGWIGAGRWTREGERLRLKWTILGQDADPKPGSGPDMDFRLQGFGNRIVLQDDVGRYEWKRIW